MLVIALALLGTLLVFSVLWLKTSYPSPGFKSEPAADGWKVTRILRKQTVVSAALPVDWLGQTITRACAASQPSTCVDLTPNWMVDSPMQLASSTAQRQFIESQQALLALGSLGDEVVFHSATGRQASVAILPAGAAKLDERVVLQTIVLLLIYALGCVMLAFVRRTPEVWLAFAMCAGYFLYMLARTWYTSRTWAQPEAAWWVAMLAFKVGVVTCGVCTALVLWRLSATGRIMAWVYAALAALVTVLVLHTLGVVDSVALGYRIPMLTCLMLILAAAGYAAFARRSANGLQSTVTLRVVSLGFTPMVIISVLWTARPDLLQIAYLQNFAVASAALPVVILVTRSAHYGMQRFWWGLWLILAASTLGVLTAGVVAVLSGLPAGSALLLGLTTASWIVYLLRAWLEKRMLGRPIELQQVLPQLMALAGATPHAQQAQWHQVLASTFEPHSTQAVPLPTEPSHARSAELLQTGDALMVKDMTGSGALLLTGAARYTRSFNASDRKIAETMHALAMQAAAARQSFSQGAVEERKRIAADLHDDIGGKLLHLANAPGAEGIYARNTLEDLRTITRGLSAQSRLLHELLSDLRFQLAQRAERHGLDFEWTTALADAADYVLGARQATVLSSICSELLRNAMQQTSTRRIAFDVSVIGSTFNLSVSNDGEAADPANWRAGLGTTSVRRRVHDLQGQCTWQPAKGGGVLFNAHWPMAAWLQA